ncbi:hypothetical protein G6N73_32585 [Mesorhizobium camelthorni]|uniref:ABM domain-containing protein n=1 Tax=Allomesorhizobium camelthorni TaxID=475069 RepID=A0A6G4WNC7_9HYPH|nr:hypothetical protein [Mesorhizobium camelthorni]
MARQPGFISISLHRSLDGRRIVNYVQWQNRDLLRSAHQSPEFRKEWDHFDQLTDEIDSHLYKVAHVMDGGRQACRPRYLYRTVETAQYKLANLSHDGHERSHRNRFRRNRLSRPPHRSASLQARVFRSDCIKTSGSGQEVVWF